MYYLQLVPDVDDERVGAWVDGDPAAFLEHLQAGHLLVHEQDGEGVGVRVRGEPEGEVRRRALGVEVHCHVLLLLAQRLLHVLLLQAQARGDGRVQPEPEPPDLSAVGAHDLPVREQEKPPSVFRNCLSGTGQKPMQVIGHTHSSMPPPPLVVTSSAEQLKN